MFITSLEIYEMYTLICLYLIQYTRRCSTLFTEKSSNIPPPLTYYFDQNNVLKLKWSRAARLQTQDIRSIFHILLTFHLYNNTDVFGTHTPFSSSNTVCIPYTRGI